jgi:hypothetical protein
MTDIQLAAIKGGAQGVRACIEGLLPIAGDAKEPPEELTALGGRQVFRQAEVNKLVLVLFAALGAAMGLLLAFIVMG